MISVIIPVYNVEAYLGKTIASLLDQSNRDFELILVDDGSTDNSVSLAKTLLDARGFPDYQIIRKENGGVAAARNTGIAAATGDYVYFLDGDDYVAPRFMETIYAALAAEEADILCWGYDKVNPAGDTTHAYFSEWERGSKSRSGVSALRDIVVENALSIWMGSALYQKQLLLANGIGFMENCCNGEDQEFIFKALLKARTVLFVDEVLSYYLQRSSSISFSYNIKRMDVIGALERTVGYLRDDATVPEEVISTLHTHNILKEYVTNFFSCLVALRGQHMWTIGKSYHYLMTDVEAHFPQLHERVAAVYAGARSLSRAEKVKYRLFFYQPKLYLGAISLKYQRKGTI